MNQNSRRGCGPEKRLYIGWGTTYRHLCRVSHTALA
jgi:hypothetical protein